MSLTAGLRGAAVGLALAMALVGCSTTAPAAKSVAPAAKSVAPAAKSVAPAAKSVAPAAKSVAPAAKVVAAPAVLQADAGGFQLTQKVRVPADARADYDNAMRLVDAGQYDQGITLLQRVTQKAPAAAAAYVDLGIAYGKSGDLDHAVTSLKRAVELNPRQVVAYNELGILYRRKGEFTAARESYEKALGVFPGFHYARLNLAILCDVYLGDLPCARENYAAYQQLVPDDAQVAVWIADLNTRAAR
jgi:Flp pilus assembly protein TadD